SRHFDLPLPSSCFFMFPLLASYERPGKAAGQDYRRAWRALLRGEEKVSKRYLIQVAARNLGLMMRKLFGVGTARSLQGMAGLFWALQLALKTYWSRRSADRIAAAAVFLFGGVEILATVESL